MSVISQKNEVEKHGLETGEDQTARPDQQGNASHIDDPEVSAFYRDSISEAYRLKSELVAQHLSQIGMGRFQYILFIVTGFGWIVDNFWSQGITAVRPPVANEFTDISRQSFSSVAYYAGLIIGASFWGITADIIGRKPAFNATIFIGGIFACAVAGTQNFVAFCALWACIGTAAGGNVPVDSIIFLEFVPQAYQWLLVSLSAWWNFGQLIVALLSWVFLANYACSSAEAPCAARDNMGWRYIMITLGALAIAFGIIRIFVFRIPESPRYLLSRGRDAEAVDAVNYIARYNGKPETLTLPMLEEIDNELATPNTIIERTPQPTQNIMLSIKTPRNTDTGYTSATYHKLFSTRKMAQHTSITFLIWLTIGIAYPLYFAFITSYLEANSSYSADSSLNHTYMVYCIVSAAGVAGPITAGFGVETRLGRRWMMGISAILTGIFLFAYTAIKTEAGDIGLQCATGVLGNFEYAVMFAFTPESFPGPIRGTGTGIAAMLHRIGGLVASLISTYSGYTAVPIYASAALWVVVGLICFGLPYETHGHASI
ncbi:major facilitator superfamily domain-containing protein [Talaromyces proteolyticus]|uniref:Major facilitator superfamily domain-containing protein n=1 Tax=Talaromyces proteolyticus TaxID=1131652 RepID=A0AAD4PVS2_9EURO|nr:major facilitator superfamily domain-containing protein [Talaromyces proteolyticus]KAH8690655.1 major facilitator superfamily domain-containing protein [Talaromyces proteolyticus]